MSSDIELMKSFAPLYGPQLQKFDDAVKYMEYRADRYINVIMADIPKMEPGAAWEKIEGKDIAEAEESVNGVVNETSALIRAAQEVYDRLGGYVDGIKKEYDKRVSARNAAWTAHVNAPANEKEATYNAYLNAFDAVTSIAGYGNLVVGEMNAGGAALKAFYDEIGKRKLEERLRKAFEAVWNRTQQYYAYHKEHSGVTGFFNKLGNAAQNGAGAIEDLFAALRKAVPWLIGGGVVLALGLAYLWLKPSKK
ncbi:MAG: hypothetical protein HUU29_00300 [Planctomycetaceae bacterium]|nr:hypothetical protein [Planctomycetaceae bacterium]